MKKIRWAEAASGHVENICDFIAADNPEAARQTIEQLFALADRLAEFPRLGRPAAFGDRQLAMAPFLIVYRIVEDVIEIKAVFHGRRMYE